MRTTNGGRQLISWPTAFDIGLAKQLSAIAVVEA
jgi:hypothetical protein